VSTDVLVNMSTSYVSTNIYNQFTCIGISEKLHLNYQLFCIRFLFFVFYRFEQFDYQATCPKFDEDSNSAGTLSFRIVSIVI